MNLATASVSEHVAHDRFYDTIYYVCKGDVSVGARWNLWMG